MIRLISTLGLNEHGVIARGKNGRWNEILMSQGDLDGACTVYSLMMVLILIRAVNRTDIEWNTKVDGRISLGRLIRTFMENRGLIRGGMYMDDVQSLLHSNYGKIVNPEYIQKDGVLDNVKESIDSDTPLMISVSFNKKYSHAMVAIGYEETDGEITMLYCLDPGQPKVGISYWNSLLHLNVYSNSIYRHQYLPENSKVSLDDAIFITKK